MFINREKDEKNVLILWEGQAMEYVDFGSNFVLGVLNFLIFLGLMIVIFMSVANFFKGHTKRHNNINELKPESNGINNNLENIENKNE